MEIKIKENIENAVKRHRLINEKLDRKSVV